MRPCLLQRIGSAHIRHQITRCENPANIGRGNPAAVGPQHRRPSRNTFSGKRDVIGDNDISRLTGFRNPFVSGVGAVIDNHKVNQRVRVRPNAAIADHHGPASVTDCDSSYFVLHRTGISINIDHHNGATIGQNDPVCISLCLAMLANHVGQGHAFEFLATGAGVMLSINMLSINVPR